MNPPKDPQATRVYGPDDRVNERIAAARLGIHHTTLVRWRQDGKAPKHYAVPNTRTIRYRIGDLDAFIHSHTPR